MYIGLGRILSLCIIPTNKDVYNVIEFWRQVVQPKSIPIFWEDAIPEELILLVFDYLESNNGEQANHNFDVMYSYVQNMNLSTEQVMYYMEVTSPEYKNLQLENYEDED